MRIVIKTYGLPGTGKTTAMNLIQDLMEKYGLKKTNESETTMTLEGELDIIKAAKGDSDAL